MRPCQVIGLPRHSDVSQDDRILSMDGPISRRELRVLKRCPIAHLVYDQLRQFPNGPRDVIDAMQGLWERTSTPPRPIVESPDSLPRAVRELMERARRRPGESPELRGTNTEVALATWR
jgi:hypothetical protein